MGDQPSVREADACLLAADVSESCGETTIAFHCEATPHSPPFPKESLTDEEGGSPDHEVMGEEARTIPGSLNPERLYSLAAGREPRDDGIHDTADGVNLREIQPPTLFVVVHEGHDLLFGAECQVHEIHYFPFPHFLLCVHTHSTAE